MGKDSISGPGGHVYVTWLLTNIIVRKEVVCPYGNVVTTFNKEDLEITPGHFLNQVYYQLLGVNMEWIAIHFIFDKQRKDTLESR